MIKRIMYLAIPVIILAGAGLTAVQNYFTSFPLSENVIEKLTPPDNAPPAVDLTETFFDDSGSMKGYYGGQYIEFLRTLKSHIREKGEYRYHAFSDPENNINGDQWKVVEDRSFYSRNDTYFDKVLDSILGRIGAGEQTAKNFLIITDGIQDVSRVQDYSRIVDKVSDLLDAGLFFQIVAVKLPFDGYKYPEGGGYIPYKGDSPLFCYIFTYQDDYGKDLYKKMDALGLPAEFLGFGNKNINASIKQFRDPAKNRDGSKNIFKRFKDDTPVTYLVSRSGTGGTLLTDVALNVKDINLDSRGFEGKTPEFCGKCMTMGDRRDEEQDLSKNIPSVTVITRGVEPVSDSDRSLGINYALFFENWERDSKTVACDITLCNWLPVNPPDWVDEWSSDCDNGRECFEGKTPFLSNIIGPILNKSVRKYTFGYAVIKN